MELHFRVGDVQLGESWIERVQWDEGGLLPGKPFFDMASPSSMQLQRFFLAIVRKSHEVGVLTTTTAHSPGSLFLGAT